MTNLISYYYFKSEHLVLPPLLLLHYSISILQKILRGKPERDCPSCGAYAGSIIYISRKSYFGYQHQTKSGNPDKRYRYNPELYSLITNWSCKYCNANFEFLVHKLSKKPNKRTPINFSKY